MSVRPDDTAKEPSHRLRFGAGLLLGTLLVAGVGHRLLTDSLAGTARFGEDRRAVVALRALTDLVARAGSGDAVRTVVADFGKAYPAVVSTRAVLFDGLSLEASTDPADSGENAAPRRLKREEKDVYDHGQRLRAAVETNRQEGAGRKEEIERDAAPTALSRSPRRSRRTARSSGSSRCGASRRPRPRARPSSRPFPTSWRRWSSSPSSPS